MKGNVLVITVTRTLFAFSSQLVYPYFSLYVLALGGTPVTIGIINAIGALSSLLLNPIGAYISDYESRVKVIAFSSYWLSFTMLFYLFAQDWIMLAIGIFLESLILFRISAMSAITADSLSPEQRGIGFATISVIPMALAMISPYIGGHLVTHYGIIAMRYLYALSVVFTLIASTIRFRFLKETLERTGSEVPFRNFLLLLKTSYKSLWETLKWMPKSLKYISYIGMLSAFFATLTGSFWIVYALEVIKLTAQQWGVVILVVGLLRIPLSILAGKLADTYGRRKIIIAALAFSILPLILFVYCRTFLQTLIVYSLSNIGNILLKPACSALISDIVPRERRGRIMTMIGQSPILIFYGGKIGYAGILLAIPMMVGSLVSGHIYSQNPTYPWFLLSAALISCLILSIIFIHEPKEPEF